MIASNIIYSKKKELNKYYHEWYIKHAYILSLSSIDLPTDIYHKSATNLTATQSFLILVVALMDNGKMNESFSPFNSSNRLR